MKNPILVAAITVSGLLLATNAKAQNAAAAKEAAIDKEKVDALQPKPTDKTGIANSKSPAATPVKKDEGSNQRAEKSAEPAPVAMQMEKQNLPEKTGKAKISTLELPQPYKTIE